MFRWLCFFLAIMISQAAISADSVKLSPVQRDFFKHLMPAANRVNQHILQVRQQIEATQRHWQSHQSLSKSQRQWLQHIATHYRLAHLAFKNPGDWQVLLQRVDIIPVSMLLAQAANESAWGQSRFARQGKNYFGEWCFTPGCGLIPKQRPKGKHYEVRKFPNVYESVASYANNLNTNTHYAYFRQLRAMQRQQANPIQGFKLADGLLHYSERGKQYVKAIRAIITRYQLARFDVV